MILHRFIRRWWPLHPHLIRVWDIGLAPEKEWQKVVAWRWRCLLCGAEMVELDNEKDLPEGTDWIGDETLR